jgi:Leucine-rich repeat (LRR) protein
VLDGNKLSSHSKIPRLPSLKTLWVNKNRIGNLSIFIDQLVDAVPNLRYLSMMNNDACPNFFNGGSLKQYQDYRYHHHLYYQ